jgi:hypothetical protein
MIQLEQNMLSGMIVAKCHSCSKNAVQTTLPAKFCPWCSELQPNYKMLAYSDQRLNYHFNKRILDVPIKS